MEDVVKQAPLFLALDDEASVALRESMVQIDFQRGKIVFSEGDAGDRLYVILDGKIKLGTSSTDGRESLLAVLGPGEMFGELSLFDPGPRTSTATALTEATLLGLGHESLRPWLTGRPGVAEALLKALSQRLRRTNENLSDLVFSDVPGRVAKALIELNQKFGEKKSDGFYVEHDLTQEELAQLVGASRETVNKALADFVQRQWIKLEPRAVLILDLSRLEKRAS
jgi:CRP/FNR family transcriptional regulator, cyclic AMP receptor protein